MKTKLLKKLRAEADKRTFIICDEFYNRHKVFVLFKYSELYHKFSRIATCNYKEPLEKWAADIKRRYIHSRITQMKKQ